MFNESVKLGWDGKSYECVITMDLIKRMERNGINILQTAIELDKGGIPPISLVSELYSWLLNAGGCDVTEESVYESIMANPAESSALVLAAKHAVSMFFPKVESSERGGKAKKKR